MHILKFEASVRNGLIQIPDKYREQIPERVKIILFPKERRAQEDYVTWLLDHPLQAPGFRPLSREEIHERAL